jgi:cytochrome c biogenesis protein ResB
MTALMIGSTAAATVGTLYQADVAKNQARYQAQVADQNRVLADKAADDALERGKEEEARHYLRLRQMLGEQKAGFAASGVDTGFGSAADIQAETLALGEDDAQTIRENATREAQGYRISAANYGSEAAAQRAQASAAGTAGLFNAGATILSGATQFGQYRAQYGKPSGSKSGAFHAHGFR